MKRLKFDPHLCDVSAERQHVCQTMPWGSRDLGLPCVKNAVEKQVIFRSSFGPNFCEEVWGFCSVQLQDQSMKRGDHPCSCCFHHARTGRKPSLLPKRKTIARDLGHSGLCFTMDSWGYFRRTRSSSCLAF